MRSLCKATSLAVAFAALALLTSAPRFALAQGAKPAEQAPCTSPEPAAPASPAQKPKFAELSIDLDENDEIAALEAIRIALSEVGDGAAYVWHRWHGRLSGIVQPTASFKDPSGRVCRHIVLTMTAAGQSGRVEGIACRSVDGRWQLEG